MSDPTLPQAQPATWTPNPLLSGRGRGQTPNFLRTQWDEATARSFGPWRVADPVEPTHAQTLTALPPETPAAPDLPAEATPADVPEDTPVVTEPQNSLSDAAIQALREQAFQEGIQHGLQEGLRQAKAQWEAERLKEKEVVRHLGIELHSLQQDPQRFFEPLKRLSLHIAEQWVRGELQVSGRVIDQLIRQCLQQLEPAGQKVHVDLHPADLERLQALGEEAHAQLQLQADSQLREGSVRVRVNESVVQDLIEHRLETMARKLLKEPDAWLQQSRLLHPEKIQEVDEQEALRKWTRRTQEVEDIAHRAAAPEHDHEPTASAAQPPASPEEPEPPQEHP